MQAIVTKYHGPTNSNGSRFSAKCARGSVRIPYDYSLNLEQNHIRAAKRLCAKFADADKKEYGTPLNENPWSRHFVTGQLPNGDFCHVFTS